jgi:hypothetical protein
MSIRKVGWKGGELPSSRERGTPFVPSWTAVRPSPPRKGRYPQWTRYFVRTSEPIAHTYVELGSKSRGRRSALRRGIETVRHFDPLALNKCQRASWAGLFT